MKRNEHLGACLERFFLDHEITRGGSRQTIITYKSGWTLLYRYALEQRRISPSRLEINDLTPEFLLEFLTHLETSRGNSASTRNNRLAGIKSFFKYLAQTDPVHYANKAQQILAIRFKREVKCEKEYFRREEVQLFLGMPDAWKWTGIRDRALLTLMVQTGIRGSEVRSLVCSDLDLRPGKSSVRIRWGKGRKQRTLPLKPGTVLELQRWLEHRGDVEGPLFPTMQLRMMSADALGLVVASNLARLYAKHPELPRRSISPHNLRHTSVMLMVEDGVEVAMISLCLGHEEIATTMRYLHHNLGIKERAMAMTGFPMPPTPNDKGRSNRFKLTDADREALKRLR